MFHDCSLGALVAHMYLIRVSGISGFALCMFLFYVLSIPGAVLLLCLTVLSELLSLSPFGRIAAEQSSRLAKYRTLR